MTRTLPTEPGWYWLWCGFWTVVRLDVRFADRLEESLGRWEDGDWETPGDISGFWGPKLEPPEELPDEFIAMRDEMRVRDEEQNDAS